LCGLAELLDLVERHLWEAVTGWAFHG
jgi:hypothetical protein